MLLDKLCNAAGPSSFEGDVRAIIKKEIKAFVDEIKVDRMGNIIAHKKGSGKKIMLDAHMDEVGFIITSINEDGTIKFASIGGINGKIIPSKVVYIGENKIPGVIGIKPIHLQSAEERKGSASYDNCFIDIGSKSKEETKKYVSLGDYAVFSTEYGEFGEGFIKAKALDDRVGCAVLIELLKENYECDLYAVFNVQEEVGERGAYVSAFQVRPDIGIALEGTVCADMPNVPEYLRATELGKGPAISIMDKSSIYNEEITLELIKIAKENNLAHQMRKSTSGGNDAGAIASTGEGAKVAAVSVPCRYIHSSVSVASLKDIENTIELLKKYLLSFKGGK
ncbi:endoglucanase [Clostridium acetobutylicum]|uniref:Endoglucanase, aminopeptidase M42 family n=1 Tax=Clostridium acetobutylicum (strain ATCC 824 / DSM 792 / JCM 1419 / IAM 19013 / LMG 5710 / NBRC 13948 / NRRL B-527 / VKM B-1787 / 2291 / W) TaxID=272562 RepID=Q97MI2_CLOAB|nr:MULTISPECIES: M42 family metallopeptidase [Clostridium]AAK78197.1 Endoglucanase, aminopeptidase M42 family [Clostridium acetobutylicum ATCC 824]ADZ19261.1 Endoglucanase, aminopeptidase M42 family [Clostridium acetobutylicum EA 2018]AEI33997.1 aminopeptidase M42 family endoglucanase [Clostridium acetobutylicum DSM 1731]AWV82004.1 M42 family peptidase [Clostridium acetobutylicum]MBC2395927.1 M42 family metallopeptidase [Clostridium acetobutylicum]